MRYLDSHFSTYNFQEQLHVNYKTHNINICNIYIPQQHASQVYIIKETFYLDLCTLEGHQLQNVTSCIPMSSTNISIIYTVITTPETHVTIVGVTISKSLQELLKLDLY